MSQQITAISLEGIQYLCGLIRDLASVSEAINNTNLADDKVFSNLYTKKLIDKCLEDANTEAQKLVGALTHLTCEETNVQPTLNNSSINVIYLYSADGNPPYQQYLKISDTKLVDLGSTSISLSDYLTATQIASTYTKQINFNALKTEVDGKVDKTSILTANDPSATDDQVYSAKAINTEVVKKTDIVTTIDSSSTNDKPAGAKVTYDELSKKLDIEEANMVNLMPFPYDNPSQEGSGISFKVDDEGVIYVSGTKTTNGTVQYYPMRDVVGTYGYLINVFEVGKTYTLSGCPKGGSNSTYRLRLILNYDKSSEGLTSYQYIDTGEGITFTIESEIKYARLMIDYSGATNTTYGDLIFKPQIIKGDKVVDFKTILNRNNLMQLKNVINGTVNGLNGRLVLKSGEDMDNLNNIGYYSILTGTVASSVLNLPVKSACLIDVYGNNLVSGTGWMVQEVKAVNSIDSPIYRRSKLHGGSWGKWQRLCTTKVADVGITYINTFENETYVKPSGTNSCSYHVINGHCIVTLQTICLSSTNNFVKIVGGLPKPKALLYSNAIDRQMNSNSGARGVFQLTTGGVLNIMCNYGDTSVTDGRNLYVTFSYPVAES